MSSLAPPLSAEPAKTGTGLAARFRELASDSIVYGLSGVITRFLTIFLVPVYTRLFTPADYGILSLVNSSVAVVSILVVLGLDNAAHRWFWDTTDEQDHKRTIASWAWCQLSIAVIAAFGFYFSADWLARTVAENPDSARYFRLAGFTIPLLVLSAVLSNLLRMQRRAWAASGYSLLSTLATIIATLVLVVFLRWGLTGVFAGQLISYAAATLVAVVALREWVRPSFASLARLREMLRYALPLVPAGLAYWVVPSPIATSPGLLDDSGGRAYSVGGRSRGGRAGYRGFQQPGGRRPSTTSREAGDYPRGPGVL